VYQPISHWLLLRQWLAEIPPSRYV